MSDYIDFEQAYDLARAVRWGYKPDKELTPSCALRHTFIKQTSVDECAVLNYGSGDAWLYRKIPAQGIIGLEFLVDGEDLVSRISKGEGFKNSALRLSATKENKVNLEAVLRINNGAVVSAGNIQVNTYGGDIEDYEIEPQEWHHVATIEDAWDYAFKAFLVVTFSELKGAKTQQPVYFRLEDGELSISSTEKGSDRGNAMVNVIMPCQGVIRFGIPGSYLEKTATVFEKETQIHIYANDPAEPTRIKFSSDLGYVELPIVNDYLCQALSRGAMGFFYGEDDIKLEEVAKREFHINQLEQGLHLQKPKPGSKRKDLLVELLDENLIISKRSDGLKKELSSVPFWSVEGYGDWVPLTVDYDFFKASLTSLKKYINRRLKDPNLEEASSTINDRTFEEWEDDWGEDALDFNVEDDDLADGLSKTKLNSMDKFKVITLTIKSFVHASGLKQWFLFIASKEFKEIETQIICLAVEKTTDLVEPDV